MADKMGFEGILYYGAAGSTASTQLTGCRDIKFELKTTKGDTMRRGTSTTAPTATSAVTGFECVLEFDIMNDTSDTSLAAMRTAANTGAAVALRGKDYSAGKGPDSDFILEFSNPWTLKSEQLITITATPYYGTRAPQNYV